ncbi:MAG TPA: anti-sigma factor antagonist [Alphaproteobacteria bacterium]|nr:anti-sigma factor antagonist [Alphaproteobacteria bacterium]
MNIKRVIGENSVKFLLSGKFTFSDHQNFRSVVDATKQPGTKRVEIDLSGVEFVDSAALGMFLVARQEATKNNCELHLLNPVGHVKNMFELSNFNTLFDLR